MKTPTIDQQITFLFTADLEATAQFYEDILGFDLALDQGTCLIYKTIQGAFIGFCKREGMQVDTSAVIFTLVTADVDGWYVELKGKGVEFDKPPMRNPQYQIYHCFFRDPNGYLIEIQRFDDPRWPQSSES